MEGYVQLRGPSDFDFEVVGEHVEPLEKFIEQCATFGVGGGVSDGVPLWQRIRRSLVRAIEANL